MGSSLWCISGRWPHGWFADASWMADVGPPARIRAIRPPTPPPPHKENPKNDNEIRFRFFRATWRTISLQAVLRPSSNVRFQNRLQLRGLGNFHPSILRVSAITGRGDGVTIIAAHGHVGVGRFFFVFLYFFFSLVCPPSHNSS